ncbi:MAG: transketolase family protein [Chloroflexi bacterium]|nr:transketolase family protein [Chloroflexota bacterium]
MDKEATVNKESMRDGFAKGLIEAALANPKVVALDADVATATKFNLFADKFPDRFFEIGIAEQNMAGVAAGMATMGLIPFIGTFACFASTRIADQVRVSIAQPGLNVKIIGPYSGLRTGQTGKTHQAVEDIALFRGMPQVTIVAPADAYEAYLATKAIVDYDGPVYLRMTRDPAPVIFNNGHKFEIGPAYRLLDGNDVTIISTGAMTIDTIQAAEELKKHHIECTVLHVPTIKPLDAEAVIAAAKHTGLVITVEEHNILAGFGGAVAEILGEHYPVPVTRVGIRDVFGESGHNEPLMEKYGLTSKHIVNTVLGWIEKWKNR